MTGYTFDNNACIVSFVRFDKKLIFLILIILAYLLSSYLVKMMLIFDNTGSYNSFLIHHTFLFQEILLCKKRKKRTENHKIITLDTEI